MAQQTKFLHHTPCEHCGSSDAKALYSDGGAFCFSCKKTTRSTVSGYVREKELGEALSMPIRAPADIGFEYSTECLEWVDQYDIKAEDLIRNKVYWSPRFNQLIYIYPYFDKPGIGLIQARNFTVGRPKYYNIGDVNQVMPTYYYTKAGDTSTLVLVEDAISAIKVARDGLRDAMPILGSGITLMKISKLPNLGYKRVIVWLDHDKYKEALRISQQIRMSGSDSFVVTSDLDPKFYNKEEICSKLKTLC